MRATLGLALPRTEFLLGKIPSGLRVAKPPGSSNLLTEILRSRTLPLPHSLKKFWKSP